MAKTKFHIDSKLYESVLELINDQHFVEIKGNIKDFSFLYDDAWLYDTAVIENLVFAYGQWDVELVFVQYNNHLKLLKRKIVSYSDKKKAALTATLMRRMAAKDQRGTLTVDLEQINLNNN